MPDLSKKSTRDKLAPSHHPYSHKLSKGRYLLLYKSPHTDVESFSARYRDTTTNKQHTEPLHTADFDLAVSKANAWFASCGRGIIRAGTVEEACKRYVERQRTAKGDEAADDAEGIFRRRVYGKPIGQIALDRLIADDIIRWRDGLLEVETKASANRELTALKAALNSAYRAQLVDSDRAWKTVQGFTGANNPRLDFLNLTQRRRLLKSARVVSPALGDLVEAALHTACRPVEGHRALVRDFDAKHRTLLLWHKKGRSGEVRRRHMSLTPAAVAFFSKLAKGRQPDEPLLRDDDGRVWNGAYKELFRAAADAAGLPPSVVMYTCRHSIIAGWLVGGVDPLTVCKLAGTSMRMLELNYSKFLRGHVDKKLAALPAF